MFEMINNRQVIFGAGEVKRIPKLLAWYGCKKVFLAVYDKSAPVCGKIVKDLEKEGIESLIFDRICQEPDTRLLNEGRDLFLSEGCDCTVAVGGGSVLDAAKAIGMLAVNGGTAEEYQMEGREVTAPPPLMIAVPTTSGTGSEATKVSVVRNSANGLKKSMYHTTMIADTVILDPELTVGLPKSVTAATGMDALSHAVESYVSLNASPLTELYGLKAVELIAGSLERACSHPEDVKARGDMMLASYLGGCAITAGIGIAHIMAQPLGAVYKIPHGDACSVFLPVSMELNLSFAAGKYEKIAKALGVAGEDLTEAENARRGIARIRELRRKIGAPESLSPYITEKPDMAELISAIMRTTGHITCNPRPVNEALMAEAFERAISY